MTPETPPELTEFVGLMTAAVALRDAPMIWRVFDHIPDTHCDRACSAVMAWLPPADRIWAASTLPTLGHRLAAREFRDRTTNPYQRPTGENPKRDLARMAFRLLRAGKTARVYISELRAANRLLSAPLPDRDLESLAVWCAERHREESDAG